MISSYLKDTYPYIFFSGENPAKKYSSSLLNIYFIGYQSKYLIWSCSCFAYMPIFMSTEKVNIKYMLGIGDKLPNICQLFFLTHITLSAAVGGAQRLTNGSVRTTVSTDKSIRIWQLETNIALP